MADDIVTRLRDMAFIVDESQGEAVVALLSGSTFTDAADEIERLQGVIYDMDRRIATLIGEHQALSIKYAAEVTRRG